METTFRQSMNWLHTWAGLVIGSVLFAVFWMGTLAVFDREIDLWMIPHLRLESQSTAPSLDALAPSLAAAADAKAPSWTVVMPTHRQGWLGETYRGPSGFVSNQRDPATGAPLPPRESLAGTGFIFPFHIHLHLRAPIRLGYWLVALAGMGMLAFCVTGVVIHRKIFADFFTFRPRSKSRRMILDLHNVTGVLGLPFHFIICLSGLYIFYLQYFPIGIARGDQDRQAYSVEPFTYFNRPQAGAPGEIASIDAMIAQARALWDGAPVQYVAVRYPGDAASYVSVARAKETSVGIPAGLAYFDAATGELLERHEETRPIRSTFFYIAGLHYIQFDHWTLRWIYFALGLAGCVLIATGYLFWSESRRSRHAALGLPGVRIVEALAAFSTLGLVTATFAYFVANRLLPAGVEAFGRGRALLEVDIFYLAWLATLAIAAIRARRAWVDLSWATALFALAAVVLNAATTGDHILRALASPRLWPIAGMDLLLIVSALIAAFAATRLPSRLTFPSTDDQGDEE